MKKAGNLFLRTKLKQERNSETEVTKNQFNNTYISTTAKRLLSISLETGDETTELFTSSVNSKQLKHTTVLWLSGFCLGQPGWAGTKRNIHPLTPIVVISHPLSASPIYYEPYHPLCSIYVPDSLFPQSPSFLWFTSWPGILHFILHSFLHPIIVFFSQHMPISPQPVLL